MERILLITKSTMVSVPRETLQNMGTKAKCRTYLLSLFKNKEVTQEITDIVEGVLTQFKFTKTK